MYTKSTKAILILVLIAVLLLSFATGCDPEDKVKEAKDGLKQLKQLADSGKCLTETLNGVVSDACPGVPTPTPAATH